MTAWYSPVRALCFAGIASVASSDSLWRGLVCLGMAAIACLVTGMQEIDKRHDRAES